MIGYLLYVIAYILFPSIAPNGSDTVQRISIDSPRFFNNKMEPENENRLLWEIGLKIQRSVQKIVATESSIASPTILQLPWEAWYRLLYLNNFRLAGMHIGLLPPVVLTYEYSSKPGRITTDFMDLTGHKDESVVSIDGVYLVFAVLILFIIICYTLTVLIKYLLPAIRDMLLWFVRMWQPSKYHTTLADSAPIILKGHTEDIECIECNGCSLVTSCLEGKVIVWNPISGEQHCILRRNEIFSTPSRNINRFRNHYDDSLLGIQARTGRPYLQSEEPYFNPNMTKSQTTQFNNLNVSPVSPPMYKTHRRCRSDEVSSRTIVESTFATSLRPVSISQRLEENISVGVARQRRPDLSGFLDQ